MRAILNGSFTFKGVEVLRLFGDFCDLTGFVGLAATGIVSISVSGRDGGRGNLTSNGGAGGGGND